MKNCMMILVGLAIGFSTIVFSTQAYTSEKQVLKILKNQFDAFNNQDIVRLVANVSDDFKWYSLTSDKLLIETNGKIEFEKAIRKYFLSKKYKSTSIIESYTIQGNLVSFKEAVSYLNAKGKLISSSAMGNYQIEGKKITRAWYFID